MCALPPAIRDIIYTVQINQEISGVNQMMTNAADADNKKIEIHTFRKTVGEIAETNFSIIHKALRQYPLYQFNNLKLLFPNLRSTKNFNACNIRDIFKDKTVNYSAVANDWLGVSQNAPSIPANLKIDLSLEDWFTHTDNYGTSEEKALVAYFRDHINELGKHYSKIFLIRNERQLHIYSFEAGERFEPDYVLLLQKKNNSRTEQWQIFIESKGKHLLLKDMWKEKFLLPL